MIVIVCCENNNGMLFNNRRVSRDSIVNERIVEMTKNSKLWMNNYSYKLFEKMNVSNINLAENVLTEATDGEYCFIENQHIIPNEKRIEKMIVFRWNRDYPSDFQLDMDLSEWKLEQSEEFKGNSHDKITMEVYGR